MDRTEADAIALELACAAVTGLARREPKAEAVSDTCVNIYLRIRDKVRDVVEDENPPKH